MLQGKAGVANRDYAAQKAVLAKVDAGELPVAEAKAKARERVTAELTKAAAPAPAKAPAKA